MPDLFDQSSDQMTHWALQPNPVHPLVGAIIQHLTSGIDLTPVHNPGTVPADYLTELLRNPDIMSKNIEQASNFNFGGMARPTFAQKNPALAAKVDEMVARGHTVQSIADETGIAGSTIHNHILRGGQKTAAAENPSYWTPEREQELISSHRQGKSQPALGQQFDLSPGAIWSKLDSLRKSGKYPDYVERGPSFSQDPARQAKFIEDVGEGYSHGELGRLHGVDRRTPGKWISHLQGQGDLQDYAPQGGFGLTPAGRTPTLPQLGFMSGEAPQADPEMANAIMQFLMKTNQLGAK